MCEFSCNLKAYQLISQIDTEMYVATKQMQFKISKYVCILLALTGDAFSKQKREICLSNESFSRGVRLTQYFVIGSFTTSSMAACIRECFLRRKCQVITYNIEHLSCDIGCNPNATMEVADHSFITSKIQDLHAEDYAGACANQNCSVAERCIELKSKQWKCMPIDLDCQYRLYRNGTVATCYKLPHSGNFTYYDVEEMCRCINGQVPKIDTEEKYRNFQRLPGPFYWIQGISSNDDSSVLYNDGTQYNFEYFSTTHRTTCTDLSRCGVCLGSNNGLMYHRDKLNNRYLCACEMYP